MVSFAVVLDAVRLVLWWALAAATVALALHYRRAKSNSTLFKLIGACIACQTVWMTLWAVHNGAVRSVGLGRLTDTLYRACIPLYEAAVASFMGLLLVLASGFCITRSNFGQYRAQVLGLPVLLFVTGVVTEYINFQVLEASADQLELFELAAWEQGLWFVCTFLNLAAFGFWVVYIMEIIQAEVDALKAQQELNLVRAAAPAAVASVGQGPPAPQAHAAPPPGMDPAWTQAAAEEGIVAYKNLLGAGQNMSHIPGADVEAQEITTVADMVNFEVKASMYRKFSTGFGVFMIAQLCVILAPVFVIDIVQDAITFFQFIVTWCFLAALLWLFRPREDSPYLMMTDGVEALDTSLGLDDEDAELPYHQQQQQQQQQRENGSTRQQPGVELAAAARAKPAGGAAAAAGDSRAAGSDQAGGAGLGLPVSRSSGLLADPTKTLTPIRTSLAPPAPAAAAAAAAAAGTAGAGPLPPAAAGPAGRAPQPHVPGHFSLGEEEHELHSIKL